MATPQNESDLPYALNLLPMTIELHGHTHSFHIPIVGEQVVLTLTCRNSSPYDKLAIDASGREIIALAIESESGGMARA